MSRALSILQGLAEGVVIATVSIVSYNISTALYQRGSLDPRCMFNFNGHVETHHHGRVSCEYRPDITRWSVKK